MEGSASTYVAVVVYRIPSIVFESSFTQGCSIQMPNSISGTWGSKELKANGVKHLWSAPYHPDAAVQTLKRAIAARREGQ